MVSMSNLYIMRHGETIWNSEKRYQGQLDSPLTETGIRRTEIQRERLKDLHFSAVYCSPLGRTRQTLEILNPSTDKTVYDDGLKEVSLGLLQGKTHSDLNEEETEAQNRFWNNPGEFTLEGAESMDNLEKRVREFLDRISKDQGPVLLVTHTVIIKMITKILESRPIEKLWDEPYLHPGTLLKYEKKVLKEVIHPEAHLAKPESYTA